MGEVLRGGAVNAVVRIGDTVRRAPAQRAEYVRELLAFFAQNGWTGAPKFLGIDERGRDTLEFLNGHVAWETSQPQEVLSDESLGGVARLVREFHDLTAGTPLSGASEVVCHNDLAPKNTVYPLRRTWAAAGGVHRLGSRRARPPHSRRRTHMLAIP